jgi:hypothetical protein
MKKIFLIAALLFSASAGSETINSSLVSFSPLQAKALKGTFGSLTANQIFTGTNQINTLQIGASGTVGAFNVYPTTASKGSIRILAADSTGNTVTTITNAAQSGAATYTIPDAGTSSFVMTAGSQTVGGAKTFSSAITPTAGVAAAGGFLINPRGIHTGQAPARVSTDGNDSTPVATETYISEIQIPANMTITGVAIFNGSVAAGNIKISLANASTGDPITAAQSASTSVSGTDAYQLVPFATPYAAVGPATYLILVQYNNTSARYNTHTLGTHGVSKKTGETYGTFTTVTPPTTFTTNIGNICGLY